MKFRKKQIIVDAIQFTGKNYDEVLKWSKALWPRITPHDIVGDHVQRIKIWTLEGIMEACPGDWIIRGVKDELYPCKPDIFEATYAPAEEET